MISKAELWRIYLAKNCFHTNPIKDKFVVVAHFAEKRPMGFLINSEVTNWLRKRPHLLVCEANIAAAEHLCLSHDSIVDCQRLYDFFEWELTNVRGGGKLSPQAKENILQAVRDCPILERKHKEAILKREGWESEK